jgi:hypothetical protein
VSPLKPSKEMQSSYWRRVKYLHDLYIYNREESSHESEEDNIKRSIQEYITNYYCPLNAEEIYMKLNNIRNAVGEPNTIEESMLILGHQWEDDEY